MSQNKLIDKFLITAKLKLLTGLHIGGNSDFSPIGSVDSPFIRDSLTHEPIIPGSSIKGKLRTLLAKSECNSYFLNDIDKDNDVIKRLFGFTGKSSTGENTASFARLQFFDLYLNRDCVEMFKNIETDTYFGEIKFENTISRLTGIANPRQIERVPAGFVFDFKLIYNIENEAELIEDMKTLATGFKLLEADYLGGHGSRGYGKISLEDFTVQKVIGKNTAIDVSKVIDILKGSI